jgi:mersacidin/lichenicidin family type 2 lantibiotic
VENAENCVHITMPAPPTGSMELSDEELSNAAGGYVTTMWIQILSVLCCTC